MEYDCASTFWCNREYELWKLNLHCRACRFTRTTVFNSCLYRLIITFFSASAFWAVYSDWNRIYSNYLHLFVLSNRTSNSQAASRASMTQPHGLSHASFFSVYNPRQLFISCIFRLLTGMFVVIKELTGRFFSECSCHWVLLEPIGTFSKL